MQVKVALHIFLKYIVLYKLSLFQSLQVFFLLSTDWKICYISRIEDEKNISAFEVDMNFREQYRKLAADLNNVAYNMLLNGLRSTLLI